MKSDRAISSHDEIKYNLLKYVSIKKKIKREIKNSKKNILFLSAFESHLKKN